MIEILAAVLTPTELVRESIRVFDEGDLDALGRLWDPHGTVVGPAGWPESGVIEGWPAIRAQFERLKAEWSEDKMDVEALEEINPGTVLVGMRWTLRGAASGVALARPLWMVATIRDGRFVRAEYFDGEAPARAAAEG